MTLIAGMISRRQRPLSELACTSFAKSVSRNRADEIRIFKGDNCFFAKVDIGAFGEPGFFVDSNGAFSLLTGEPLLDNQQSPASTRLDDLTRIHKHVLTDNWDILKTAAGTFSLVHYQPLSSTVTLVADKLGVRPIYYWWDDNLIVFASALRILEDCPLVPKTMDLRAVTEGVGLDTLLADRTPYAGIFLLKPAEVLQVTKETVSRRIYWRWDEIEVTHEPEQARLAVVHDRFLTAVRRRNRSNTATTAYLSGGLDSRSVVTALSLSGVRLHTVNFARVGTQDHYCGNEFAARIGSIHQSVPKQQGDRVPDYSLLMARAIDGSNAKSNHGGEFAPERPRLVWSGEGGSCLLGHIHHTEAIIELMRAGNIDGAIEAYLEAEQVHVPAKLFRARILGNPRDAIKQSIREELDQFHAPDPGRNFYLFLALNDQRRKLMRHFENIDQHQMEFQLPFFDAQFVSAIMGTSIDWCLRHKFYMKWLSQFPPVVTAVPWQTYPGHEPCPLPVSPELGYQWDASHHAKDDESQKKQVLKQASKLLQAADFPDKILSRRNLRVATWIHASGWRNYSYTLVAAQTYYHYAKKCGGEFVT